MAPPHTQLTQKQLIELAARMSRRLSTHLDRLDGGDDDALDDVAGVTRMALGFGDGNDVIHRLCRQNHVEHPSILVGVTPEDDKSTVLSVGNVPEDSIENPSDLSRTIGLREWQNAPAVVSKGNTRRITKWHQLVTDYGNTYGAHLSQTVPHVLTEAELYGAPGGRLGAYLLRAAAVFAEKGLAETLVAAGYDGELGRDRKFSPEAGNFGGMTIYRDDNGIGFRFDFFITQPGNHDLALIPVPLVDKTYRIYSIPEGDGFRLAIDESPLDAQLRCSGV